MAEHGRLIDVDTLMDKINNSVFTADMTTTFAVNMACRWIENAPTIEPEPHWIPCSEKMPEEHEWVGTKRFGTTISDEVYVTFETSEGERFAHHINFQNGKLSDHDQMVFPKCVPIAWMPLPDPWGGKQDESD